MQWYGGPETPYRATYKGNGGQSSASYGPPTGGAWSIVSPHAGGRVPPQRPAGGRSKVCQRPFRSGPGRLPRPAWPAAWWSSGRCGPAFGGPPSGQRRPYAAAARPRAPPRWPVAAAGAFPRPAPLRRGTCAAVPLRWAGRRRAAGVVGPGVRWVWPARCGARAVLPASPRVRLPSAFLGRVPLPPPLSGPPPTALGARRHSCGGIGGGRQAGQSSARFWRRRRPPPLPPLVGYCPLPCCAAALWPQDEICRKVSNLVTCCQVV